MGATPVGLTGIRTTKPAATHWANDVNETVKRLMSVRTLGCLFANGGNFAGLFSRTVFAGWRLNSDLWSRNWALDAANNKTPERSFFYFCIWSFLSSKVKWCGPLFSLWKEMTESSLFSVKGQCSWLVFLLSRVGETQGSVSIHWTLCCFAFNLQLSQIISSPVKF